MSVCFTMTELYCVESSLHGGTGSCPNVNTGDDKNYIYCKPPDPKAPYVLFQVGMFVYADDVRVSSVISIVGGSP